MGHFINLMVPTTGAKASFSRWGLVHACFGMQASSASAGPVAPIQYGPIAPNTGMEDSMQTCLQKPFPWISKKCFQVKISFFVKALSTAKCRMTISSTVASVRWRLSQNSMRWRISWVVMWKSPESRARRLSPVSSMGTLNSETCHIVFVFPVWGLYVKVVLTKPTCDTCRRAGFPWFAIIFIPNKAAAKNVISLKKVCFCATHNPPPTNFRTFKINK